MQQLEEVVKVTKTHIFGELDLDLSKGPGTIYDQALDISEQCGYFITLGNSQIIVEGTDNDVATITFHLKGPRVTVHHYAKDDDGNMVIPVREVKIE